MGTWNEDEFGNRSWHHDGWVVRAWRSGGVDVETPQDNWEVEVFLYGAEPSLVVRGEQSRGYDTIATKVHVPFSVINAVQEAVGFVRGGC